MLIYDTAVCREKQEMCVHSFASKDTAGSINKGNMILDHI